MEYNTRPSISGDAFDMGFLVPCYHPTPKDNVKYSGGGRTAAIYCSLSALAPDTSSGCLCRAYQRLATLAPQNHLRWVHIANLTGVSISFKIILHSPESLFFSNN